MLNLVIKVNKQNHRSLPSFLFLLTTFSHSNWDKEKMHVFLFLVFLLFFFFVVQCFVCNAIIIGVLL